MVRNTEEDDRSSSLPVKRPGYFGGLVRGEMILTGQGLYGAFDSLPRNHKEGIDKVLGTHPGLAQEVSQIGVVP
jgi:hypothetical protein